MASRHPVDAQGRALPPCDWPAERAAPGELERIRRFCNTTNLESGADGLATAAGLDAWLAGQRSAPAHADPRQLQRIVEVRELLRAHAIAHRGNDPGPDVRDVVAAVEHVPLRLGMRDGAMVVEPAEGAAADRFLAGLALVVIEAIRAGTWQRLKACRNCSWVFYDASKNRSGQWCSMSACGGRDKIRNHRRRTRASMAR